MDCSPESPAAASCGLFRQAEEGSHLVRLQAAEGAAESFLALSALPGESPVGLFQRLYQYAANHPEWRIVRQDVFGMVPNEATHRPRAYRLNGSEWPVNWVAEGNGSGNPVTGIQIHAVDTAEVVPVRWEGRTVGARFEDAWASYCVLAGLQPISAHAARSSQTRDVLERMERILESAGFTFRDVIRTWFYLDDILDWYGEFNQVRNRFFEERGVYAGLVPASTGVGGGNAAGSAVVADLLAVRAKDSGLSCAAVPSPLQSAAFEYGSSFSRAVQLVRPGLRRLYVSGTASILPDGRTAHVGDVVAQVALTMEVVAAILGSQGMGWSDAVRGIAYFKHMEDAPELTTWLADHRVSNCPLIVAKNDICRDDLLFELELDAVRFGAQ